MSDKPLINFHRSICKDYYNDADAISCNLFYDKRKFDGQAFVEQNRIEYNFMRLWNNYSRLVIHEIAHIIRQEVEHDLTFLLIDSALVCRYLGAKYLQIEAYNMSDDTQAKSLCWSFSQFEAISVYLSTIKDFKRLQIEASEFSYYLCGSYASFWPPKLPLTPETYNKRLNVANITK